MHNLKNKFQEFSLFPVILMKFIDSLSNLGKERCVLYMKLIIVKIHQNVLQ